MESFDTATATAQRSDGAFTWQVPDGWQVGRGAWGGLVVGALARAISACEPDAARALRSVSAELSAPAGVGPVVIEVSEVRRGSGLSVWSATATDADGAHVARLNAVLATARADTDVDTSSWSLPTLPGAPAAEHVPVAAIRPPLGPVVGQHLEFRPIRGVPTGGPPAETLGYVRLREPVPHTSASLLGIVDAWWPATLTALDRMRPVSTVGFSANLLVAPDTIAADEPLLHHGTLSGLYDGFCSERRRLWSSDGRLVVENLQSMVIVA